jgi:hypothetical protein
VPPTREIPLDGPVAAEVEITDHCVERYVERVKPDLELRVARAELEQLKQVGTVTSRAPVWAREATPAAYYLMIGSDIVLPLAGGRNGWWASTCLVFTGISDLARDRRRALKSSKASAKRARRRAGH